MSRLKQYLSYLAVRVALCWLQSLRIETFVEWVPRLAWLCADVLKLRHSSVEESLQIAFPDWSAEQRQKLTRRMWEHLFLLMGEVALAGRKIHESNWRQYLRPLNLRPMAQALLDDRPVLVLSGHFGNFELGNYVLGVLGVPTLAVARELDNEYLDRYVRTFRAKTGQRIVDKKGGYDDIEQTLAAGGAVSMLVDQYAGGKACWVNFFGRPASTHKAIALLGIEHQARLVVSYTRRLGKPLHYELVCDGVFDLSQPGERATDVTSITQWYTSQLEHAIRTAPEQYWWVHRRWKDHRSDKRRGATTPKSTSQATPTS